MSIDLVQLLKQADLHRYLESLVQASDDIVIDSGRLRMIHDASLGSHHSQGQKKDLRLVYCRICCPTLELTSRSYRRAVIGGSQPAALLQGVLPLLLPLSDENSQEAQWLNTLAKDEQTNYLHLLFSALNVNSVRVVETESEAWKFLLGLVEGAGLTRRYLVLTANLELRSSQNRQQSLDCCPSIG